MIYLKYFESETIYDFKTENKDENYKIIAYLKNSKNLIGSISLQIVSDEGGWYWFEGLLSQEQYEDLFEGKRFVIIENIKVDEQFQKSGLGSDLMIRTLNMSKELGTKLIVLNASPLGSITLDKLETFYKKFGFKIFKKQGKNTIMIKRI